MTNQDINVTVTTAQPINVTLDQTTLTNSSFIALADTPSQYTGSGGYFLKVNSDEDALEFSSSSANVLWGDITGTLSDQSDLQSALNAKLSTSSFNSTFDTRLATKTTDNLTQGSTNKYDRTVVLTAGSGISTSGTYPSFTITNSDKGSTAVSTHESTYNHSLIATAIQQNGNISDLTNDAGYITSTLTQEQVQDYVGGMVSGNTETLITVNYQDTDGTLDFVVEDDLSLYDNSTSGFITSSGVTYEALNSNSDVGTTANTVAAGNDSRFLTSIQKTDLTDSGDSSLHYHSADRNRANHTGTQTASTISDFDTEVSNNSDVSSNTGFRTTPSSVITAGTNISWDGNTLNAAAGSVSSINDIGDVVITSVSDNELLVYDSTSGHWINQTPSEAGFATVATSGSYSDLSDQPTITDEKVKYDSGDTTAGYVSDKIIAGDGISVAEGTAGNENKLVVTNSDKGSDVDLSGLVPYTGASGDVNLGTHNLTTTGKITVGDVEMSDNKKLYLDSAKTSYLTFNSSDNSIEIYVNNVLKRKFT